jgi:hypothetical protein
MVELTYIYSLLVPQLCNGRCGNDTPLANVHGEHNNLVRVCAFLVDLGKSGLIAQIDAIIKELLAMDEPRFMNAC